MSAICDYIFIISEGRLVASDTPANLTGQLKGSQQICLTIKGDAQIAKETLEAMDVVASVAIEAGTEEGTNMLYVSSNGGDDMREQISLSLSQKGIAIFEMKENSQTLEDIFIELTEKEEDK